jgi:hypothetical protein
MTLSNPAIAACSGALIIGAYFVDSNAVPFVAAGVAATWARILFKKTAIRSTRPVLLFFFFIHMDNTLGVLHFTLVHSAFILLMRARINRAE